jgi:hypothetical protein
MGKAAQPQEPGKNQCCGDISGGPAKKVHVHRVPLVLLFDGALDDGRASTILMAFILNLKLSRCWIAARLLDPSLL